MLYQNEVIQESFLFDKIQEDKEKKYRTKVQFKKLLYVKDETCCYNFTPKASSPQDVKDMLEELFDLSKLAEECFCMLSLDVKKKLIGAHIISKGNLNSSLVHPREVFKYAILDNAASIVVAHNHPSGDPTPSSDDREVTKRLVEAGEIIGIELVDHIVIGNYYMSFKEQGYM